VVHTACDIRSEAEAPIAASPPPASSAGAGGQGQGHTYPPDLPENFPDPVKKIDAPEPTRPNPVDLIPPPVVVAPHLRPKAPAPVNVVGWRPDLAQPPRAMRPITR
jgi:hypothetical protein